jgi:hypothetical protein
MSQRCNHCEGTGFLNLTDDLAMPEMHPSEIAEWVKDRPGYEDVAVCDCCGDGSGWHGVPGEHYNEDDQPGLNGPYAYNGGLCECH